MSVSEIEEVVGRGADLGLPLGSVYNEFVNQTNVRTLLDRQFELQTRLYGVFEALARDAKLPLIRASGDIEKRLVIVVYLISRLVPSRRVADNAYLGHFVGAYNAIVASRDDEANAKNASQGARHGPLERLLYMLLAEPAEPAEVAALGESLSASSCSNIRGYPSGEPALDVANLRQWLAQLWLEVGTIDNIMSAIDPVGPGLLLHRLHGGAVDKDKMAAEIDRLVDELVQTGQLDDLPVEPFNSVSSAVFQRLLATPSLSAQQRGQVIRQLTRIKATNATVDFVHMVVMGELVSVEEDEVSLLVYEFVMFNLQRPEPTPASIRLISRFVLSLHDSGKLKPVERFHVLFSSFITWIGTVNEARQVYLLT